MYSERTRFVKSRIFVSGTKVTSEHLDFRQSRSGFGRTQRKLLCLGSFSIVNCPSVDTYEVPKINGMGHALPPLSGTMVLPIDAKAQTIPGAMKKTFFIRSVV